MIFKEATLGFRRTPVLFLFSALALGLALGLVTLLLLLTLKADTALVEAQRNITMEVFFVPELSTEEAHDIAQSSIGDLPEVASHTFISKEQALIDYKKASGEDVDAILGMNPLPASVVLSLKNPTALVGEALEQKVKAITGVDAIHFDRTTILTLEERKHALQLLTWLIGGLLLVSSIAFLWSIVRFAVQARQRTAQVLHYLGASKLTIRAPYYIEGILTGLLAGCIGFGLVVLLRFAVLREISPALSLAPENDAIVLGIMAISGIMIGLFASRLSVQRLWSMAPRT